MINELNRIFEQLNNQIIKRESNINSDVIEYSNGYEVLSDIPGVLKENIKVSFEGDSLTINVDKKEDGENADYKLCERSHAFEPKTIYFDENVDITKIEAKYINGVLRIYVPKMPKKETNIKID